MSNIHQEYQNELTDIARYHSTRPSILKQKLQKLVGLSVVIDCEENPGVENYDPLLSKHLMNCIGEYLRADEHDIREQWSILILTHITENFKKYYESQIKFDLEDKIESIIDAENDIDSQADRALEEENGK